MHRHTGIAQAPLDELHRSGGHNRLRVGRLAVLGDGRPLHFGEPSTVGAHGDHGACRTLRGELQQHASQRVAARFVVGGKDRASDQLPHQGRCEFEACLSREGGNRWEFQRILCRQAELAPRRLDDGGGTIGMNVKHRSRLTLPHDRHQSAAGQEHGPGSPTLDRLKLDTNAHLQIGGRQHGRCAVRFEFDIRQHRLWRTGRHDSRRTLEGGEQGLTGETHFHRKPTVLSTDMWPVFVLGLKTVSVPDGGLACSPLRDRFFVSVTGVSSPLYDSLFEEDSRKETAGQSSNRGPHSCRQSRRLRRIKMTLEESFSRPKHSIAAWVSRFIGCGKPDGSLSFPCRATVLQGLVCRPFPASGRWHRCWSAASCVWMACVPKCRLIAVGLLESELTRCQQALASGAGGADFWGTLLWQAVPR